MCDKVIVPLTLYLQKTVRLFVFTLSTSFWHIILYSFSIAWNMLPGNPDKDPLLCLSKQKLQVFF